MKEITTHRCGQGLDEHLRIDANDAPEYGAHHHYLVYKRGLDNLWGVPTDIRFQKGPIFEKQSTPQGTVVKRNAPNGVTHEALLAIIIDRLEGFQAGPFACSENKAALTNLRKALRLLQKRTEDRVERGVEGEYKP